MGRRCKVRGCSRAGSYQGRCQTHHRQWLLTGRTRPIRPYRDRTPGTVKVAGLRLSSSAARHVQQFAREEGVSLSAAVASIVEDAFAKMAARFEEEEGEGQDEAGSDSPNHLRLEE